MSFISTLYDYIYSSITTAFPTKTELKNPQDITDNTEPSLSNGFGVHVESLISTNEVEQRLKMFERSFVITFTRKATKSELNLTARKDAEKLLLEDQNTFIQNILSNTNIISRVMDYQIVDDNGVEFIYKDQKNFLMIKTKLVVKYYLNTNF